MFVHTCSLLAKMWIIIPHKKSPDERLLISVKITRHVGNEIVLPLILGVPNYW